MTAPAAMLGLAVGLLACGEVTPAPSAGSDAGRTRDAAAEVARGPTRVGGPDCHAGSCAPTVCPTADGDGGCGGGLDADGGGLGASGGGPADAAGSGRGGDASAGDGAAERVDAAARMDARALDGRGGAGGAAAGTRGGAGGAAARATGGAGGAAAGASGGAGGSGAGGKSGSGETGSPCKGNKTLCGLFCVATQSDPLNCGGCGVLCRLGEKCSDGSCVSR